MATSRDPGNRCSNDMLYFTCTNEACGRAWTKLDGNGCKVCDAPCEVMSGFTLSKKPIVEKKRKNELVKAMPKHVTAKRERISSDSNDVGRHQKFEELLRKCVLTAPPASGLCGDGRLEQDSIHRSSKSLLNSSASEDMVDSQGQEPVPGVEVERGGEGSNASIKVAAKISAASTAHAQQTQSGRHETAGASSPPRKSPESLIQESPQSPAPSDSSETLPTASHESDPQSPAIEPVKPSVNSIFQPDAETHLKTGKKKKKQKQDKNRRPLRPGQHNAEFRRIMSSQNKPALSATSAKDQPRHHWKRPHSNHHKPEPELPLPDFLLPRPPPPPVTAPLFPTSARSWHQVAQQNAANLLTESKKPRPMRPNASYLATLHGGAFGELEANAHDAYTVSFGMRRQKHDVRTVIGRALIG